MVIKGAIVRGVRWVGRERRPLHVTSSHRAWKRSKKAAAGVG